MAIIDVEFGKYEYLRGKLPKNVKCLAITLSLLLLIANFSGPIVRILQRNYRGQFSNVNLPHEGVHLIYTGYPTEVKVCWFTEPLPEDSNKYYAPKLKYRSMRSHKFRTVYGTSVIQKDHARWRHEVLIRNLNPSTTYTVIIDSGRENYQLTTFPLNPQLSYQVTFCSTDIIRNAKPLTVKKQLGFYVTYAFPQDIKANPQISDCGKNSKTKGKPTIPYIPESPDSETLSVKLGNIRLISVQFTDTKKENIVDKSLIWLMKELETVNQQRNIRWVVVLLNKPLFCTRPVNDQLSENVKNVMRLMFYLGRVDLILQQGCDTYERTHPVYDDKPIYITIPEAPKTGEVSSLPVTETYNQDWIRKKLNVKHSVLQIQNNNKKYILLNNYEFSNASLVDESLMRSTDYKPSVISVSKTNFINTQGRGGGFDDEFRPTIASSNGMVFMISTIIGGIFGSLAALLILVCICRIVMN